MMCTWRIFLQITWWKNFESRSTFAKVIYQTSNSLLF